MKNLEQNRNIPMTIVARHGEKYLNFPRAVGRSRSFYYTVYIVQTQTGLQKVLLLLPKKGEGRKAAATKFITGK